MNDTQLDRDPNEARRAERLTVRRSVKAVLQNEWENDGLISWMPLWSKQLDQELRQGTLSNDEWVTVLAIWTYVVREHDRKSFENHGRRGFYPPKEYSINPTVPYCGHPTLDAWLVADEECFQLEYEMHRYDDSFEHYREGNIPEGYNPAIPDPTSADDSTHPIVDATATDRMRLKEAEARRAEVERACEDGPVRDAQENLWFRLVKDLIGSITKEVLDHCRSVLGEELQKAGIANGKSLTQGSEQGAIHVASSEEHHIDEGGSPESDPCPPPAYDPESPDWILGARLGDHLEIESSTMAGYRTASKGAQLFSDKLGKWGIDCIGTFRSGVDAQKSVAYHIPEMKPTYSARYKEAARKK
ncbi:hypothetical protein NZK35_05495 [Stieleria sp. ICT_E10.1]|uniref:hypothetical protein n=1 Tax=Stieleria sedimenti TaxID=2976331 RepID=UPI0021804FBD|nr:hypothetical protein [Stieleria sedimenti]MCS7466127.1 hypothetical protein [Stieleria sedimenti]